MKHDVEDGGATATLERTSNRGTAPVDKQEVQKKMEAAGTPGPAHKALEPLIGNWKAEVKCFHDKGEQGQGEVSHGTAKVGWILNGHYLEQEFHGEMMGKRFTGKTILGFDNVRQMYRSVWMSDMQTSILSSEGKAEQGNKVITLEGKSDRPVTGRRNFTVKTIYRLLSSDKHVFELYDEGRKAMEITYTRA